jgi:hypothetical protein
MGLTADSYRPVPNAEFEIQVLNDDGQGELVAFFEYASNRTVALVHAIRGALPVREDPIPRPIVDLCRDRMNWPSYYMDEEGQVTLPSFLCPTDEAIQAERARVRRRDGI